MRIEKVFANNYHNLENFELSLKALTPIVGENGAGKSSILQAIELAVTGDLRDRSIGGKALIKNFDLSKSDQFTVGVGLCDGTRITRRFQLNDNGKTKKVTQSVYVDPVPLDESGKEIGGTSKLSEWVRNKVGDILFLNFADPFYQSSGKRFEYMYGLLAGDDDTVLPDELQESVLNNYDGDPGNYEKLTAVLTRMIDTGKKGMQLINDLLIKVCDAFTETNAVVSREKGATRSLRIIASEQKRVSDRIDVLKKARESKQTEKNTLQDDARRHQELMKELDGLTARLTEKTAPEADAQTPAVDIDAMSEKLAAKEESATRLRGELDENKAEWERSDKTLAELEVDIASMEKAKAEQVSFEAQTEAFKDLKAKLEHEKTCPLCGGNNAVAESFVKMIEARQRTLTDETMRLRRNIGRKKELEKRKEELLGRIIDLNNEIGRINSEITILAGDIQTAKSRSQSDASLSREIESLNLQKANVEDKLATIGNIISINTMIESLSHDITELDRQIEEKSQENGMLLAQKEAQRKHLEAVCELQVYKFLKRFITEMKAEVIRTVFKEFEARINADFQRLDGSDYRFVCKYQDERGKLDFRMGLEPSREVLGHMSFIDFDGPLNSSRKVKLLLAFLCNIPAKDSLRLYLLDDIQVVSKDYLQLFFDGLKRMKGKYDTLVVTSGYPLPEVGKDVVML